MASYIGTLDVAMETQWRVRLCLGVVKGAGKDFHILLLPHGDLLITWDIEGTEKREEICKARPLEGGIISVQWINKE